MKTAILILLSVFAFTTKVFADDGVKDPMGFTTCEAKENFNMTIQPDVKPFKKINCKEMLRWSNTIDFKSDSGFILSFFIFDAKKIKDCWWLKVKLTKTNEFVWISIAGYHGKPELLDDRYIERETEMSGKWDGKIYPKPEFKNPKSVETYSNAMYKEIKTVNGRQWVRVEIISRECIPAEEPPVLATGWVPFMHSDTESNFYEQQNCE